MHDTYTYLQLLNIKFTLFYQETNHYKYVPNHTNIKKNHYNNNNIKKIRVQSRYLPKACW